MMMKALLKGFWRVVTSPGLIIWLWLVNFFVALPLVWVMTNSLSSSIGGSLVDEKLTASFDMDWYGEFEAGAKGLETTFSPTVVGMGAFYNNLEAWLYGDLFDVTAIVDQPFRAGEAKRQRVEFERRAHQDIAAMAFDFDSDRLFDGDGTVFGRRRVWAGEAMGRDDADGLIGVVCSLAGVVVGHGRRVL